MGGVNANLVEEMRMYDDWQMISRTEHFSSVVKDRDGYLGEEYLVPMDGRSTQNQELELYSYRRAQNVGLVKVYGAEIVSMRASICGGEKSLKVVTEYLPKRLSTIHRFSFPQALYVLSEMLKGFREISRRFGPIFIEDDMIAFTSYGRARCWSNPNFALNHPRSDSMIEHTGRSDEAYMVTELFNLVEERTVGGRFPGGFNRLFSSQTYMDFPTAQRIVEDYAHENGILVPEKVDMTQSKNQNLEIIVPNYQQVSRAYKAPAQQPATTTTTTTTTIVQDPNASVGFGLPLVSQPTVLQNTMQLQYLPQAGSFYAMQPQGIPAVRYY